MRENTGGKPDMVAEDPPSRRVESPPSERRGREDFVVEPQPHRVEEARLERRAKHQALWLMASSALVSVMIVAGIWMLLR